MNVKLTPHGRPGAKFFRNVYCALVLVSTNSIALYISEDGEPERYSLAEYTPMFYDSDEPAAQLCHHCRSEMVHTGDNELIDDNLLESRFECPNCGAEAYFVFRGEVA